MRPRKESKRRQLVVSGPSVQVVAYDAPRHERASLSGAPSHAQPSQRENRTHAISTVHVNWAPSSPIVSKTSLQVLNQSSPSSSPFLPARPSLALSSPSPSRSRSSSWLSSPSSSSPSPSAPIHPVRLLLHDDLFPCPLVRLLLEEDDPRTGEPKKDRRGELADPGGGDEGSMSENDSYVWCPPLEALGLKPDLLGEFGSVLEDALPLGVDMLE